MEELLAGYPIRYRTDVRWGDMDAFQHVNNVAYLRWFESGRVVCFDALEVMRTMEETGQGPILKSQRCRYRIPLEYPDHITVGIRIRDLAEDRFVMEFVIVSERHGKVAAEGDGEVVYVDYRQGGKTTVPEAVVTAIHRLGAGG